MPKSARIAIAALILTVSAAVAGTAAGATATGPHRVTRADGGGGGGGSGGAAPAGTPQPGDMTWG